MSIYIGEHIHALDDKGRVSMPAKFREDLGEIFYITLGMDQCLFVYDEKEWSKAEKRVRELGSSRKESRVFARLFFSRASQISLDRQGRFVIPPKLREYAQLKKEVAIIGVSSRIEIWDNEKWDAYNDSDEFNYEALVDYMDDIDF